MYVCVHVYFTLVYAYTIFSLPLSHFSMFGAFIQHVIPTATTLVLYKDADYVRNPQNGMILESCVDRICQNILTNLAPGDIYAYICA